MSPSVREQPVHNVVRLDEKDRIPDTPVSGFTAVNGRSPPQTLKLSGNGSERRHSRAELSPESDRPQDRRLLSQHPDRPDRPPSPRPLDRDARLSSPGKRRRSLSDDDDEDRDSYKRRASRDLRAVSVSSNSDFSEDEEPLDYDDGDPAAQSRDFDSPHQLHGRAPDAASGKDRGWYERSSGPSGQYADVLQREPQSMDAEHRKGDLDEEEHAHHPANDYGSTTEITRAGVQVDVKKRKRVFSNRTKTGCQTCRRRKKKCDEAKPECNNCTRGGFVCEGYLVKTPWTKPGMAKSHVPLQSKHGYTEHPGIYPRPTTEAYPEPRPPQSLDGARPRPIAVDDERASMRSPWTAWHTSAPQERVVNSEYPRTAPPTDVLRQHRNYSDHNSYQHGQSGAPHVMAPAVPPPPHLSTSQSAVTAQLALQHQSSTLQRAPQPHPQGPQSDKDKMVSGDYFFPFSQQLVEEREQCKAALWRFNSLTNPVVGASASERLRLFRAILEPPHVRIPRTGLNPVGSLGKDVCIETPFYCDYGYNIVIGDDVVIGPMCTILDARRVKIGARTILGPNVNIYTIDYSKNPTDRKGSKALAFAQEVTIEEEVYIGGNVTILPGAYICRGSTIAAGSVVTRKRIPKNALAAGCPAQYKDRFWEDNPYARPQR